MNLHNINPITQVAIWFIPILGNGHSLRPHLWITPEGTPPEQRPETRPPWSNPAWWRPSRFNWTAYNTTPPHDRWTPPLCGLRSRSTQPRFRFLDWQDRTRCPDCERVAAEQRITATTRSEANLTSPARMRIMAEELEWVEAGRPETWPAPQEPQNDTE